MAGVRKRNNQSDKITLRDVKILLSAGLLLGAVFIKTSPQPWAENLKIKAVNLLNGGISAQEVVAAAGQTFENGDLQAVFAAFNQNNNQNAEDTAMVYAEAPFSEDLISKRQESNFPKEEDITAYVLDFETCKPVDGIKTSDFGQRVHPVSGEESFHYGLDIAADEGTKILSFADGVVRESGTNSSYGNYIIVDHADGISTLYAHCSKVTAKQGDKVKAGDKIAEVGATGIATGNHLHFEVWRDGKILDPSHYVFY